MIPTPSSLPLGSRESYDKRRPTSAMVGKDLSHSEVKAELFRLTGCEITRFSYNGDTGYATWKDKDWKI